MAGFGAATASLGALSFQLHKELAEQHNGRETWGYSLSTGTSLLEGSQFSRAKDDDWLANGGSRDQVAATHEYAGDKLGPAWLTRRQGDRIEVLSEDGGVAQV
jgi:hypothetical protein